MLKINGTEIVAYPDKFSVTTMDLDSGESSVRTADGTLNRDRVAVKRQVDMTWGSLSWVEISSILQSMGGVFFDLYYPDPMTGQHETKKFYVGNRPAPFSVGTGDNILWSGLKITLTQQ